MYIQHTAACKAEQSRAVLSAHTHTRTHGRSHTHTHTHTQGHTDTPVCSDKLLSETPVGLLFTFSHRRHHPLEQGCQGMLGNSHSDLIVLRTHSWTHR